jgi:hypothetical protein
MLLFATLSCTKDAPPPPVPEPEPASPTDSAPPEDTAGSGETGTEPPPPLACGTPVSVSAVGGWGFDSTRALAPSADGGWSVAGTFQGKLTLDGPPIFSTGPSDGFVARYAPDGAVLWVVQLASPEGVVPEALAPTSDGGLVVVGSFSDRVTLGAGQAQAIELVSAGGADGFALGLDEAGTVRWAVPLGGAAVDGVLGVGVLSDGAALIAGLYRGEVSVGGVVLPLPGEGREAGLVARIEADGAVAWAQSFGGTEYAAARAAVLDPLSQELVVVGTASGLGAAVFGAGQPGEVQLPDLLLGTSFIARWQGDGTLGGVLLHGGTSEAVDIAPDGVVVAGTLAVPGLFGGVELDPLGTPDPFVARFDVQGALLWVAQGQSVPDASGAGRGVAATPDGGALLVGELEGKVIFDPGAPGEQELVSYGATDAYAARFDGAGALSCAAVAGGTGEERSDDAALLLDGTFLWAGSLQDWAVFSPQTPSALQLEGAGQLDGFLARYTF